MCVDLNHVVFTIEVKRMELHLDILESIGKKCDDHTRLNLSLASKEYHLVARDSFACNVRAHFIQNMKDMMDRANSRPTYLGKLRMIHKLYRYMIENKYALDLTSRIGKSSIKDLAVSKLDEYVLDGMCKRRAARYRSELRM